MRIYVPQFGDSELIEGYANTFDWQVHEPNTS